MESAPAWRGDRHQHRRGLPLLAAKAPRAGDEGWPPVSVHLCVHRWTEPVGGSRCRWRRYCPGWWACGAYKQIGGGTAQGSSTHGAARGGPADGGRTTQGSRPMDKPKKDLLVMEALSRVVTPMDMPEYKMEQPEEELPL
jgi:hypothetical protein